MASKTTRDQGPKMCRNGNLSHLPRRRQPSNCKHRLPVGPRATSLWLLAQLHPTTSNCNWCSSNLAPHKRVLLAAVLQGTTAGNSLP